MEEISERFPRNVSSGEKYPRVFRAESLEDMQQARGLQAKGLRRRADILPNTNFGSQPFRLDRTNELSAVIFLPGVQHYPAMDPQEDIKGLHGLTLHENLSMKLTDKTGSINVWHYDRSFMDFPYLTCFNDVIDNTAIFNKDKWKACRDISWNKPVILLAQYAELSGSIFQDIADELRNPEPLKDKPVTEYYWLIDVFDVNEEIARRGRKRLLELEVKPVLQPGGMTI